MVQPFITKPDNSLVKSPTKCIGSLKTADTPLFYYKPKPLGRYVVSKSIFRIKITTKLNSTISC